MIEILAYVLAGLGLFFVGLRMIDLNLRQIVTRKMKLAVSRFASHPISCAWWGTTLGMIIQSTTAFTFLCIGMMQAGLMTPQMVASILAWFNTGPCFIVFVATLPINVIFAVVVGVVGICYAFEIPKRWRTVVPFFLGVALLFFGLFMIQGSTAKVQEYAWFRTLLEATAGYYFFSYLAGAFLSSVAQSSVAVTVVAVILAKAGLIGLPETVMIAYGANLGSAITTWLLSLSLKGRAKRIAVFQVCFNLIGSIIFVSLFYTEIYLHVPLLLALLSKTQLHFGMQAAIAFLLYNLVTSFAVTFGMKPFLRGLERFYPDNEEDLENQLKYLNPHSVEDPIICLDLIEKEEDRLSERLPSYLEKSVEKEDVQLTATNRQKGFQILAKEISGYMDDLFERSLDPELSHKAINLVERLHILENLNDSFSRISPLVLDEGETMREPIRRVSGYLREALEAMRGGGISPDALKVAAEVAEKNHRQLTKMREKFSSWGGTFTSTEQAALFQIVAGADRITSLLYMLARNRGGGSLDVLSDEELA